MNQPLGDVTPPAGVSAGSDHLALALGGGGARAAYQVGLLRSLARRRPDLRVPVLTGVSAGAINAVQLANFRGTFAEAIEGLRGAWLSVDTGQVFRTDAGSLWRIAFRWMASVVLGGTRLAPHPRGLVDTAPLRQFLRGALGTEDGRLEGIQRNITDGRLRAVGITTTHYGTGRSITWVQGEAAEMWTRPRRESVAGPLHLEHVMASAAIPIAFPAVRLGAGWHGDGSIAQIAPLSPALHLGASRILTVSTRALPGGWNALDATPEAYPPPAQIVGVLMNSVFLDALDFDILNLNRISALIGRLPRESHHGLRAARALVLRPSRDLGTLAREHEWRLPRGLRFLLHRLGDVERRSLDLLSMILFEPSFIRTLLDLGESDGEQNAATLESFLAD